MDTPITDDYVISLLQKEAQPSKLGSAFPASKRDRNAPKPNTRFLRNLVRDADSHNSALLAKEKAETRARLRGLEREGEKRSRDETTNDEEGGVKRRREDEREGRWKGVLSGLGQSSTRERREKDRRRPERSHRDVGESSRSQDSKRDENRTSSRREHRPHRKRSPDHDSGSRSPRKSSRRERRRSHSQEAANRHSDDYRRRRSHSRDRHGETKRRSRSPHRRKRSPISDPQPTHNDNKSDSDPLDSLIGPAPPPISRPRGRGANNTTNRTTIDLRFNDPSYNPRADVAHSDSEGEGEKDQWATSLEALRDRAAWREKGAQRLREAGFGDRDVEKWEGSGREKDERDLRWRARGEGREWDAGKVAGEEGEVRVKAAWTQGL